MKIYLKKLKKFYIGHQKLEIQKKNIGKLLNINKIKKNLIRKNKYNKKIIT